jgi:hypothetical protein
VVSAFIERMQSVHDAINCMVDSRFSAALEEAAAVDSIISCASPADIQAIGKYGKYSCMSKFQIKRSLVPAGTGNVRVGTGTVPRSVPDANS